MNSRCAFRGFESAKYLIRLRSFWKWIAALILVLLSSRGLAGETTVLIVGAESKRSLIEPLQRELESVGFAPRIEWHSPEKEPFADFAQVAREKDITVLIRVFDDVAVVEIWMVNPDTQKVLHRDAPISDESRSLPMQSELEIAELLRAAQIELFYEVPVESDSPAPKSPPLSAKAEPPRETAAAVGLASGETTPSKEKKHRLFFESGPGISAGTFSHPPTAYLNLAVRRLILKPVSANLFGHIPLSPVRTGRSAGKATLKTGVIGLEAVASFDRLSKRFEPSIGGGAGIALSKIRGDAQPGFSSQSGTLVSALLHLEVKGAVIITNRLALTFGGILAHSFRKITVSIDDIPSIQWGDVILSGSIGVEIGLL